VKYLTLVFLLSIGCYNPHAPILPKAIKVPYTWKFECGFPSSMKVPVIEGFIYWNNVGKYRLFNYKECNEYADLEIKASKNVKISNATTKHDMSIYATASSGGITFYFSWYYLDNHFMKTNVARHEIGHVLGFRHHKDPDCLMYPTIGTEKYHNSLKNLCADELNQFNQNYRK
jgi:hypothetical protein